MTTPSPTQLPKLDCGGCTLCCIGEEIVIQRGEPHWRWRTDRNRATGERTLKRKANGDCVYLSAGGCGIHGGQPVMCVHFDCRDYAIKVSALPAHERARRENHPRLSAILARGCELLQLRLGQAQAPKIGSEI